MKMSKYDLYKAIVKTIESLKSHYNYFKKTNKNTKEQNLFLSTNYKIKTLKHIGNRSIVQEQ